jgi:hypothetical protein
VENERKNQDTSHTSGADFREISSIYEIYINGQSVYPNELSAQLADGDEVAIGMLYIGG